MSFGKFSLCGGCCGSGYPCSQICGQCQIPGTDLTVSWFDENDGLLGSETLYYFNNESTSNPKVWTTVDCNEDNVQFSLSCSNTNLILNPVLYDSGCMNPLSRCTLTASTTNCGQFSASFNPATCSFLSGIYGNVTVDVPGATPAPSCCWWCAGQVPDLSVTLPLIGTWTVPYSGSCIWYGETQYNWPGNSICSGAQITIGATVKTFADNLWHLGFTTRVQNGVTFCNNSFNLYACYLSGPPNASLPVLSDGVIRCQGARPYIQTFGINEIDACFWCGMDPCAPVNNCGRWICGDLLCTLSEI